MTKKITILFVLAAAFILGMDAKFNYTMSDSSGGPSGNSGDPMGGNNTCAKAACHDSYTVTAAPSTTITVLNGVTPVTSYTPNTTYNVVVVVSNPVHFKSGFQATFQNNAGSAFAGTLTAGTNNQLVGSGHYVTHTSTSNTGGVLTWNFTWASPAAGAGTVKAYCAINKSDASGTRISDSIKTIVLTLPEAGGGAGGVEDVAANSLHLTTFPNPVVDGATINYSLNGNSTTTLSIFNLNGELVNKIDLGNEINGKHSHDVDMKNLSTGTYLVQLKSGEQVFTKKIVKE